MLSHLFSFLDLGSILKCRELSRKFKTAVEQHVRPKGLSCREKDGFFEYLSYPFDHKSIRGDTLFFTENASVVLLTSEILRKLLQNLRQLNLNFPVFRDTEKNRSVPDVLIGLNELKRLERLRIDLLQIAREEELNLPNLKYLAVLRIADHKLRIVAPSLIGFETELELGMFEFDDYQLISDLKMKAYHADISKFKNLRRLYLGRLYMITNHRTHQLPEDVLRALPHLNELHWAHEWANLVPRILAAKHNLNRSEFRPLYHGLLVSETSWKTLIRQGDSAKLFHPEERFDLILRNYNELPERLPYNDFVDYSQVVAQFPAQIPDDFIRKFSNLRRLIVCTEIDREHFTEFLKQCRCLAELRFTRSGLPQDFFDQLYLHQPLLIKLAVLKRTQLDYTFLSSLHNLNEFETNRQPTYQQVADVFNKRNFWSFICSVDNRTTQLFSCDFYGHSRHFFKVMNSSKNFKSRTEFLEDLKHTLREIPIVFE